MIPAVPRPLRILLLSALLSGGCTSYGLIAEQECGNRILEPEAGEDCDGEVGCHEPTTPGACRFSCLQPFHCPAGFGCGIDGICRLPQGSFLVAEQESSSCTVDLAVGDLAGDGRKELIRTTKDRTFVHFLDDELHTEVQRSILKEPSLVAIGDLTGNGREDLAFPVSIGSYPSAGIAVLRSMLGRTFLSQAYATIPLPGDNGRIIALNALPPTTQDEAVGLIEHMVIGLSNESTETLLSPLAPLDGKDLVGMAKGDLKEDPETSPCDELAIAGRGDDEIFVLELCQCSPTGEIVWRSYDILDPLTDPTNPVSIRLPEGTVVQGYEAIDPLSSQLINITEALHVTDWNQDGHLDLLIATTSSSEPGDPTLHIAFGVGDGSFHSELPVPESGGDNRASSLPLTPDDTCDAPLGVPLAVQDLNADGLPDLITSQQILIRDPGSPETAIQRACDLGWRSAIAADLNHNGTVDIVGARRDLGGLDFLDGFGDGTFSLSVLATEYPAFYLTTGDVDGDLNADLVYAEIDPQRLDGSEEAADASGGDLISVAFGSPSGPPEPAVEAGQLREIIQIATGRLGGGDSTSDIVMGSRSTSGKLVGALIEGKGNRQLFAPFVLLADPSGLIPIPTQLEWLETGQFDSDATQRGMVAITRDNQTLSSTYRIWRVRSQEEAELEASRAEESLAATTALSCPSCSAAVLDLSQDGIDEVVTFSASTLAIYQVVDGEIQLARTIPSEWTFQTLDESGNKLRPLVRDLDLDGLQDIAVLSSLGDLLILWNLGNGQLSLDSSGLSVIPSPEGDPQRTKGAAFLNADEDPDPELVLISESQLLLLQIDGSSRTIQPPAEGKLLPTTPDYSPVAGADRIVSGDLDGDGVEDLIIGDGSSYTILRGLAVRP